MIRGSSPRWSTILKTAIFLGIWRVFVFLTHFLRENIPVFGNALPISGANSRQNYYRITTEIGPDYYRITTERCVLASTQHHFPLIIPLYCIINIIILTEKK